MPFRPSEGPKLLNMGSKWAYSTCLPPHFWSTNNLFSRHFVTPEWPKWLAMGLKSTHFTCLCTLDGLGSFLEKFILDPFWSQNKLFSKKFVPLKSSKCLAMGSKRGHSTCLGTPKGLGAFLGKHIFDPFLTHFWSQNIPFSRHFVTRECPKWLQMGSKWAHFTCLCTPKGLGSLLEKHIFASFLSDFWSPKQPIFKEVCDS